MLRIIYFILILILLIFDNASVWNIDRNLTGFIVNSFSLTKLMFWAILGTSPDVFWLFPTIFHIVSITVSLAKNYQR